MEARRARRRASVIGLGPAFALLTFSALFGGPAAADAVEPPPAPATEAAQEPEPAAGQAPDPEPERVERVDAPVAVRGADATTQKVTAAAAADYLVDPSSFNFGEILVGLPATTKTFSLTYNGAGSGGTLALVGSTAFSADVRACGALAPGASCTFTVDFTAPTVGTFDTEVRVDDGGTTHTIATIQGSGTAQEVGAEPYPLIFPNTPVGGSSTAELTYWNNGTSDWSGTNVVNWQDGQPDPHFTLVEPCTAIPAGSTCKAVIEFTPDSLGAFDGSVDFTGTNGSFSASFDNILQATGVAAPVPEFDPAAHDFGTIAVDTGRLANFSLRNVGSAPLTVAGVESSRPDMAVDADCADPLAPTEACRVSVTISAAAPEADWSGTVTAHTDGGPAVLPVTGTVSDSGALPAVTADPLDLGDVVLDEPAATTITLANGGTTALDTGTISMSTPGLGILGPDWSTVNNCGTTLGAGDSCTVVATFEPSSPGPQGFAVNFATSYGGVGTTVPANGIERPPPPPPPPPATEDPDAGGDIAGPASTDDDPSPTQDHPPPPSDDETESPTPPEVVADADESDGAAEPAPPEPTTDEGTIADEPDDDGAGGGATDDESSDQPRRAASPSASRSLPGRIYDAVNDIVPDEPSALTGVLPTPLEMLRDPTSVLAALEQGMVWTLLIVLATFALQKATSSRYGRWSAMLAARMPRTLIPIAIWFRGLASDRWMPILAVFGVNASVLSLIDPDFGFNAESIRFIISITGATALVVLVPVWIAQAVAWRRWQQDIQIRTAPIGLAIAAAGVLISRLLGFLPGLLSGQVYDVQHEGATPETKAQIYRLRLWLILAVGVACWLLAGSIRTDAGGLALLVHDLAVAATVVAITGCLLELIPLSVFAGAVLFRQMKVSWAAMVIVAATLFGTVVMPLPRYWLFVGDDVLRWLMIAGVTVLVVFVVLAWMHHRDSAAAAPKQPVK